VKSFFIYHDRMAVMRRSGPGPGPGRRTFSPNPEMQREELVNLEKENARAIKFQESNIFQSPRTPKIFTVSCATEKS
jgi:hypothetical protein